MYAMKMVWWVGWLNIPLCSQARMKSRGRAHALFVFAIGTENLKSGISGIFSL